MFLDRCGFSCLVPGAPDAVDCSELDDGGKPAVEGGSSRCHVPGAFELPFHDALDASELSVVQDGTSCLIVTAFDNADCTVLVVSLMFDVTQGFSDLLLGVSGTAD